MMLNNDSTDQIRATEMLEDMVHLSLNNVAAAAAAASASTSGNNNSGGGGNSSSSTNSASSTASTVSSATSASATPAPPPPAPPTTTGEHYILARKFKFTWFFFFNLQIIRNLDLGAKIQIFITFQASHHRHQRLLHPWEMWPIWPICRLRSGQRPSPAERLSTTSRTTMLEETPTMSSLTRARSANCRLRYNSTASS